LNILDEDKQKLKKLRVQDALDLALIIPHSYENNFISSKPKLNQQNVIDALVLSVLWHTKYLKLKILSKNFGFELDAIIFNPKSYHRNIFKVGERLNIRGKLEKNFAKFQLLQPKVISEINTIIPKYKTPLQNKTLLALMKRYIKKDILINQGLKEKQAEILMQIHNPSMNFVSHYESSGFSDEVLKVLKYVEIFNHLKKLTAKKRFFKATSRLLGDVNGFIEQLPFTLTNDQKKAIEDIKKDLQSKNAAKRVIMGDVGCGKTVVILASAMIAYPKKAVLMAPTTILAAQIYEEAKKYLPKQVKIAFYTQASKKENLENCDFIIGTHALLYAKLPKCDLVMIDEQHRFGTKQREMIKQLVSSGESRAHFLQFSATPIPRTMSLIQSSLVDFSFIKELPFKKDITTKIINKSYFKKLIEHINSQIKQAHQTIIVYPLVEESEIIEYLSIDEAKNYWQKNFKNVFVTHGKDKDKEEVISRFKEKGDILLSTTVVEVGISLPRLTTIVIVAPERLGLATLHQLRGRVSRNGLKGYCFLYTNNMNNKRLKDFSKTLNGFEIAELDLKYRQSGDIIKGEQQSGKSFRWIDLSSDEDIVKEAKRALN